MTKKNGYSKYHPFFSDAWRIISKGLKVSEDDLFELEPEGKPDHLLANFESFWELEKQKKQYFNSTL
jgi:hypothetical protein